MRMHALFAGLGTALPPGRLDAQRAATLLPALLGIGGREARALAALIARSGVRSRPTVLVDDAGDVALYSVGGPWPGTAARMVAYREWAPLLAERAARAALADAGWDARDVTALVVVTCTGFSSPGVDLALVERLGLAPTISRVQVGFMGCHGAINGLSVARGLAADPDARVLLVAVELCTLHFGERAQPGAEVAGVLFGDGAAAAAIGGPLRRGDLALTATGSLVLPGTSGLMSWDVGDHGFEMGLSAEVPGEIETRLSAWLEPWLRARGLSIADVGGWAVHPGGTRILDAVEAALSLPKDALRHSREHLAEFGNLSSPTVLFLVERLRAAGMRPPHVLLAFGPGLSAEVALLESVQG